MNAFLPHLARFSLLAAMAGTLLLAPFRSAAAPGGKPVRAALAASYGYEQLVILYPFDRSTVFDSDGEIDVHMIALSRREPPPGTRFELLLDGWPVQQDDDRFVLRNLSRGFHQLRARIVAADGATIADTQPTRFYNWHAPGQPHAADDTRAAQTKP